MARRLVISLSQAAHVGSAASELGSVARLSAWSLNNGSDLNYVPVLCKTRPAASQVTSNGNLNPSGAIPSLQWHKLVSCLPWVQFIQAVTPPSISEQLLRVFGSVMSRDSQPSSSLLRAQETE